LSAFGQQSYDNAEVNIFSKTNLNLDQHEYRVLRITSNAVSREK